jgi:hypothetical protein
MLLLLLLHHSLQKQQSQEKAYCLSAVLPLPAQNATSCAHTAAAAVRTAVPLP